MTIVEFIILVLVAGVLGAVTQSLFGFKVGGFFISVILGFVGGWFGTWIAEQLNLPPIVSIHIQGVDGGFPVIWSIAGCLIITCGVAWMQRKGAKEEKKK